MVARRRELPSKELGNKHRTLHTIRSCTTTTAGTRESYAPRRTTTVPAREMKPDETEVRARPRNDTTPKTRTVKVCDATRRVRTGLSARQRALRARRTNDCGTARVWPTSPLLSPTSGRLMRSCCEFVLSIMWRTCNTDTAIPTSKDSRLITFYIFVTKIIN